MTLAELLRGRTVDEIPVVAVVAAAGSLAQLPPGEVVIFTRAAPAVAPLPAAVPPSSPPATEENKEASQL